MALDVGGVPYMVLLDVVNKASLVVVVANGLQGEVFCEYSCSKRLSRIVHQSSKLAGKV